MVWESFMSASLMTTVSLFQTRPPTPTHTHYHPLIFCFSSKARKQLAMGWAWGVFVCVHREGVSPEGTGSCHSSHMERKGRVAGGRGGLMCRYIWWRGHSSFGQKVELVIIAWSFRLSASVHRHPPPNQLLFIQANGPATSTETGGC